MRNEPSIIADIAEIQTYLREAKERQFVGSNQMVMNIYQSTDPYDWGGELTAPSQTPSQKGRGLLVTVTGQNQDNLVADLIVEVSKNSSMTPLYTRKMEIEDIYAGNPSLSTSIVAVPLSIAETRMKKWRIFMIGNNGQYAYVKIQAVANDDVTLSVVQII